MSPLLIPTHNMTQSITLNFKLSLSHNTVYQKNSFIFDIVFPSSHIPYILNMVNFQLKNWMKIRKVCIIFFLAVLLTSDSILLANDRYESAFCVCVLMHVSFYS